jgi:ferredoxin
MTEFEEHPAIQKWYNSQKCLQESYSASHKQANNTPLSADSLSELCLRAGADDVGFVEVGRSEINDQYTDILEAFPRTKTLICYVCRMNPENVRSPLRSIANNEFQSCGNEINKVSRTIVESLAAIGVRALNPSVAFPQEMDRFPGKLWSVSYKPVAVAAGLGHMGLHRNVIHPKFGSFIFLGVVLMDAEVTAYSHPIDYNPCIDCRLCVSACPVGAISDDGHFNFSACYTHNYREWMSGFTDWVETIADSKSARDYRQKINDAESASMWQSLSFSANYKSAYCQAVCPAGDDIIGHFLSDRKEFVHEVMKPLQDKSETVYVISGSDAEVNAARRFPHKAVKRVSSGIRSSSIRGFLSGLQLLFQRNQSEGLNAVYHFTFTGSEAVCATVAIQNKTLQVQEGHVGHPSISIVADSNTWLRFLRKEQSIIWALMRRKIRVRGSLKLLRAFGKCFPS